MYLSSKLTSSKVIPLIKNTYAKVKQKITNKKTNKILFFITEIILIALIIIGFYFTITIKTNEIIFLPKGSTNSIITYLNKNDYPINFVDKIILKYMLGSPQSGWIDLKSTKMSKIDFLYKLTTSKSAVKKIILIPGETYYFFLDDLSRKLKLSKQKLFDEYQKLAIKKDGNILAETYNLPLGMNEKKVVEYLFNYSQKRFSKILVNIDKDQWYKYITIASIIQKEAANKSEMPIVSSVIHNRLKRKMRLQMDGTLNYGKYSHTKVTPKMIKDDNTSYNTYKTKKLPNDPICAVSIDSLKASINPIKSNYLYFVKDKKLNSHNFSATYKQHRKNIKSLR